MENFKASKIGTIPDKMPHFSWRLWPCMEVFFRAWSMSEFSFLHKMLHFRQMLSPAMLKSDRLPWFLFVQHDPFRSGLGPKVHNPTNETFLPKTDPFSRFTCAWQLAWKIWKNVHAFWFHPAGDACVIQVQLHRLSAFWKVWSARVVARQSFQGWEIPAPAACPPGEV